MQGGPAQVVDVVDLDLGLDQPTGDVGVAAVGCPDQPGAIEGVLGIHVGAVLQCEVQQLQVSLARGDEVGALHCVVLGVHIGASGDEGSGAAEVVVPGGGNQLLVQPGQLLRAWLGGCGLGGLGVRPVGRGWARRRRHRAGLLDAPEVAGSPPLQAVVATTVAARTAKERIDLMCQTSVPRPLMAESRPVRRDTGTLTTVTTESDKDRPVPTVAADDPRAVAATRAVQAGDLAVLESLLATDLRLVTARIGDADCYRTLLHAATDWPGHFPNGPAVVERLVAAGADVNAYSQFSSYTETAALGRKQR